MQVESGRPASSSSSSHVDPPPESVSEAFGDLGEELILAGKKLRGKASEDKFRAASEVTDKHVSQKQTTEKAESVKQQQQQQQQQQQ